MKKLQLSRLEYFDHKDYHQGFCKECNVFTTLGIEPEYDPRGYDPRTWKEWYSCELCKSNNIYGAYEALINKMIILTDDKIPLGDYYKIAGVDQ